MSMTKPAFFNLYVDKSIRWKFFFKHLQFSFTWIIGILILFFRGDLFLLTKLSENTIWIGRVLPYAFVFFLLLQILFSKWYYILCLFSYPVLLIFWFIPKTILLKGKIYLLSSYVNLVVNRIKRYKSTIIHSLITILTVLLLVQTDSNIVRILSMIYFSFVYLKIVIKYLKKSLQPTQLFGFYVEEILDEAINDPETSLSLLKSIEENKHDDKLNEEEKKNKRVRRLIITNTVIEHLSAKLKDFTGKKAFFILGIIQLLIFIAITIIYFTFINFELYAINSESFRIIVAPSFFEFLYYTIKTLIFSNIESILPVSILAKVVEIYSFFMTTVFAFLILATIFLSFKQERINSNIQKATEVCTTHNRLIEEYIKQNYQNDIQSILNETDTIKSSITNIKRIIERIL